MGRAQAIIARLDQVLTNTGPKRRTVVKRIVTRTGDQLIGRTTNQISDSTLKPQPFYDEVHNGGQTVLVGGTTEVLATNYTFIISPTSLSLADLTNPNLFLVLVDSAGKEEQLRVTHFTTTDYQGQIVSFSVMAQTVTKQGA